MSYSENTAFIAQVVYIHHLKSRTQLKNKGTKEDNLKNICDFSSIQLKSMGHMLFFDPTYFNYINKNKTSSLQFQRRKSHKDLT